MNILTLDAYKQSWYKQNPHAKIEKPKAVRWPFEVLVPMGVGLIAVNILSAAHTAPVIASTVVAPDVIRFILGIVGVLAVEFTMFTFMFISMEGTPRSARLLRGLVILLALVVAIIANVSSTVNAMTGQASAIEEIVAAGVLGAFAPLANLSAGEVLRHVLERVRKAQKDGQEQYKQALMDEDKRLRDLYLRYLKKYNIVDPTEVMRYSAGEPATPVDDPVRVIKEKEKEPEGLTGKVKEIADRIVEADDLGLSYAELVRKYNTSPNTIQKIKKYYEQ